MEGLFLIAAFTVISAIGEALAVGIGLLSDRMMPEHQPAGIFHLFGSRHRRGMADRRASYTRKASVDSAVCGKPVLCRGGCRPRPLRFSS